MVKLYTSYYGAYSKIPSDWLVVGISAIVPEWLKDQKYTNFVWNSGNFMAPSMSLLEQIKSKKINEETYSKKYLEEVTSSIEAKTGYPDMKSWLTAFSAQLESEEAQWKAVVFMCYEKPENFCHRHLLRKLILFYGFHIEELDFSKTQLKPASMSQSALF